MNSANDIELIFRGIASIHTFNSFEGVQSFFASSLSDLEQHFRGHGKMYKDNYAEPEINFRLSVYYYCCIYLLVKG